MKKQIITLMDEFQNIIDQKEISNNNCCLKITLINSALEFLKISGIKSMRFDTNNGYTMLLVDCENNKTFTISQK